MPYSEDVRSEGVHALVKQMGITRAAMFIRENMSHKDDYLNIKAELFGESSVNDLVTEIKNK